MPVQSQMSSPGSQGTWGSPAPGDHLPSLQSPCSPLSVPMKRATGGKGSPYFSFLGIKQGMGRERGCWQRVSENPRHPSPGACSVPGWGISSWFPALGAP